MGSETFLEVEGKPFRISSPDKVMFPEQGWSKLEVANHFLLTGEGALRGVHGRPTMLKRWPGGAGADPFYNKRAKPGDPMETVEIRFPSQRPGLMRVPRTVTDILRMAQLNCLDLNPWNSRAEDIDHPDEMRIDLDPTPDVPFSDVRTVAAWCHEYLAGHNLTAWPKTSGSRGIHVYVRLEPEWDYVQVRRAVLAVAREAERELSGLATTAWWKEERAGVFIDYNQNARDKTIASAYSVRPTGFVSAPFEWDELDDIEIEAFPMVGFDERWEAVGDLSDGIDESAGRLETLLELVAAHEEQGMGDAPWPPHYPKQPGEPPRVQPSKQRRPDDEY
ncbi:MAG: ATP-dependent DNA ligase [Acidimicrobiia bacterium]|nr:ATP-dependent DNA ligase [Acidimicrobiia bacterium]